MAFSVSLADYFGPLDLLLHLVRKHELRVEQLQLASVTEQFIEHARVLEQLDIDSIGAFLEVASTLIEIKSRVVLPRSDEEEAEVEATIDNPQEDLVDRLLEYKRCRDAADELRGRAEAWRLQMPRVATDQAERPRRPEEQPLASVELWDLVSAFGRVMQEKLAPPSQTTIAYDTTPIHVYVRRVYDRLVEEGETRFVDLFPDSVHKSQLVAVFLAVLELVRHGHALVEQPEAFRDLTLRAGPRPLEGQAQVTVAGEADAEGDEPQAG
ncbi:MAG: segregation/condensation protein A [Planctomycetota bacterium]